MKPCSASGIQSVCRLTTSGHTPFNVTAPELAVVPAVVVAVVAAVVAAVVPAVVPAVEPAAGVVPAAVLLDFVSEPQATATSETPTATVSSDLLRRFFM
jgi:hypothetical protein